MKNEKSKEDHSTNGNAYHNRSIRIKDLRPVLQFLQFDGKICAHTH